MCMYVCACFVGIILYVLDSGSSNVLNMSSWGKQQRRKQKCHLVMAASHSLHHNYKNETASFWFALRTLIERHALH